MFARRPRQQHRTWALAYELYGGRAARFAPVCRRCIGSEQVVPTAHDFLHERRCWRSAQNHDAWINAKPADAGGCALEVRFLLCPHELRNVPPAWGESPRRGGHRLDDVRESELRPCRRREPRNPPDGGVSATNGHLDEHIREASDRHCLSSRCRVIELYIERESSRMRLSSA